ncbi:MAG TPA: TonB family protein [Thermoanaerobaculia bacterium]|jgi:TonB family protein|nr:TonB family protein [Thermoanaerobaculia bacterium]
MRDRVADVLAQRRTLERGAGSGVALSLLLHAGIVGAAVWAAIHQPAARTANVLNIKFAPMPAVSAPLQPAAKPAPVKKTIQEPRAVIETPKPAVKPEPKTVPLSPFGQSTRKGSERPAPPPPTPAPAQQTSTGPNIALGGTGVTGIEGGDFPYTIYIDRMHTLIGQHWLRPQATPGTTTTVSFVIDRDGTIRDVRTETSSGNGTFDRGALRAVLEASPLPPLPFGYSGNYLGVHLTFK